MVIANGSAGAIAQIVADHFAGAQVHLLTRKPLRTDALTARVTADVFTSSDDLRLRIVERHTPQLVIDATSGMRRKSAERLGELLYILPEGGSYLATSVGPVDGGRVGARLRRRGAPQKFSAELIRLTSDRDTGAVAGAVHTAGRSVLVHKTGRHFMKLTEQDATAVLTKRYGTAWGAELLVHPSETLRSRAEVTANHERCASLFPDELQVPPMYLREYYDVICAPRQLILAGSFIAPASFHHPSSHRQVSRATLDVAHHFAEVDDELEGLPTLPGTYFHLDSEMPHAYGHVFAEDMAKLWGWDIANERYPDLRILRSTMKVDGPPSYLFEALEAYGISASLIDVIDRPVRVERLITASQLSQNRGVIYASELLSDTWDRLREGLRSRSGRRAEKFFVSRETPRRACLNGAEVETRFAHHGFEILRPELLPLSEQVELFATARVIAGYGGSGMLNMSFAEQPGMRIIVSSDRYTARNEFLISAVKGADFHYFCCPARPLSELRRGATKMQSDFEFDFEHDGDALERLLLST